MFYLPYERLFYKTNLPPKELIEALSKKALLVENSYSNESDKSFIVKFPKGKRKFSMLQTRIILKDRPDKLEAKITIQFPTIVLLFLSIWFGFMGWICFMILKKYLTNTLAFNPAMYLPFFLFFGGYLLLLIGFKTESAKHKRIIAEIFN